MSSFHYNRNKQPYKMASNKNKENEKNIVENLNEHLTGAEQYIEKKKKVIFWIVGIIIACGAFVLAYLFIFRNPRLNKSFEEYANVELKALGNDSIATLEYMKVADKYGNNGGGTLAALHAGENLYQQGDYKKAAKYLEKFSTDDAIMQANAYRLLGDCYVNLDDYNKAIKYFDKAISRSNGNPQITPGVLMKKAAIYDEQKKYDEALKCYEEIQTEYPDFSFGLPIDSYIEREKARLGK